MNKENLLRVIAESGYNAGFGAKKNFATFDIVEKAPGWVGFGAIFVAVFSLYVPELTNNNITAIVAMFGVASVYIGLYSSEREKYNNAGKQLTECFYKLKELYFEVKSLPAETDFSGHVSMHQKLYQEALHVTISKQIFLSDWYAHFKFFWQQQTNWLDEQLHFGFWRDEIPLSLTLSLVALVLGALTVVVTKYQALMSAIARCVQS